MMDKPKVIAAVIALTAGLMFAGSLIGVSPSNAIEGGNITLNHRGGEYIAYR